MKKHAGFAGYGSGFGGLTWLNAAGAGVQLHSNIRNLCAWSGITFSGLTESRSTRHSPGEMLYAETCESGKTGRSKDTTVLKFFKA